MITYLRLTILTALAIVLISACSQTEDTAETVTKEEVKEEIKEAGEATASLTKQEMDAFAARVEGQLESLDGKMKDLQHQAEELESDAKAAVVRKLEELRKKKDAAQEQLDRLKSSSADAWAALKIGLENAITELDRAMDEAAAEFDS
ncbi:MAG: hypothetical protein PVF20_02390 [Desulfobacterales bacterium]|jgi:hypothetical protein